MFSELLIDLGKILWNKLWRIIDQFFNSHWMIYSYNQERHTILFNSSTTKGMNPYAIGVHIFSCCFIWKKKRFFLSLSTTKKKKNCVCLPWGYNICMYEFKVKKVPCCRKVARRNIFVLNMTTRFIIPYRFPVYRLTNYEIGVMSTNQYK